MAIPSISPGVRRTEHVHLDLAGWPHLLHHQQFHHRRTHPLLLPQPTVHSRTAVQTGGGIYTACLDQILCGQITFAIVTSFEFSFTLSKVNTCTCYTCLHFQYKFYFSKCRYLLISLVAPVSYMSVIQT